MVAGILEGLTPRTIERFGGLVTAVDRFDLPSGSAARADDIEFFPGGFRSRAGLVSVLTGPSATTINGLKEWIGRDGASELLGLSASGIFWRENAGSYFPLDDTLDGGKYEVSMYLRSCTAFGREYVGFSDGKRGVSPPREYIGGTSNRFSQDGPGTTCTVADTANPGVIAAGVRRVIVVYLLREGGITAARGYATFTAAGSLTAEATGIPTGPAANVVGRQLFMTKKDSAAPYFSVPDKMTIWDNTTDTWEFDVSEAELSGGQNSDDLRLLQRAVIGPCAGVEFYNRRLFAWGCLNESSQRFDFGLANTHFDGGFYDNSGDDIPNGWTPLATGGTGGEQVSGMGGASGDVYRITSDGASTSLGAIYEAQTDVRTIFRANASYGIRVRAKLTDTTATGALRIRCCTVDVSDAITATHATTLVPLSQFGPAQWVTVETSIATGSGWPVTQVEPVRWVIDLAPDGGSGLLGNTKKLELDYVVPYDDSSKPVDHSLVRASLINEPAFDATNGFLSVSPQDGYDVRNVIAFNGSLYFFKEKSTHVTRDTGAGEPASWPVDLVSNVVGASGVNSVGRGDGWVLIVGPNGAFKFDGSAPLPLHEEIQPTWDRINWLYGHLVWCVVDRELKRAYIGVPYTDPEDESPATTITRTLVLDYESGWGELQRAWSPWSIAAPSCALSRRSDGRTKAVFGGLANDIDAYVSGEWGEDLHDGEGTVIPWCYETAQLSLEGVVVRHLWGYATMRMSGLGPPALFAILPDGTAVALPQTGLHFGEALPSLEVDPLHDVEIGIHLTSVKLGLRWGPNDVDDADALLQIQRATLWAREHPAAAIRGGGRKDPDTDEVFW